MNNLPDFLYSENEIRKLKEEYDKYEDAKNVIIDFAVNTMLHNRYITNPHREWLYFNNQLRSIRNNVMERLEKEDYFK